jgi:hypothetical protein
LNKITKIATAILMLSGTSLLAFENEQKLIFFKDLAHYKTKENINIKNNLYLELSDTAVLKSFAVKVTKDDKRIPLKRKEIIKQAESNVFLVNKNKSVTVNGKPYTFLSNGADFLKLKNDKKRSTYIPKDKIDEISFEQDINTSNHLVNIVPYESINGAKLEYSYTLGNINWEPSYSLYLKGNKAYLDYEIAIDNQTHQDFKNVDISFVSESIVRYYSDFKTSNDELLFNRKINYNSNDRGFDKFGYDRNGYSINGSPSTMMKEGIIVGSNIKNSLVSGKRVMNVEGKVNIPSKKTTYIAYKQDKEFEFKKINYFELKHKNPNSKGDKRFVPTQSIVINRDNSKYHLDLSAGVFRIFAGTSLYENQLLKEEHISKKEFNEGLNFDLGDNHNIVIDSNAKTMYESKYNVKSIVPLKLMLTKEEKIHGRSAKFKEIKIDLVAKNISKGEKLIINSRHMFTQDKDVALSIIEKLKNTKGFIFENHGNNRGFDNWIEVLSTPLKTKHTLDEKFLKNNNKMTLYVLEIR